VKTALWPT